MKITSIAWALALGFVMVSCGAQRTEQEEKDVLHQEPDAAVAPTATTFNEASEQPEDEKPRSALSSNAAVVNTRDTLHQFVRTAEMKCMVQNVVRATHAFERVVAQYHGFVTYTHLHSNVNSFRELPIGTDSILSSSTYTVINNMTLRVPNIHLDTVLKSFAQHISYFDYRIIKADDVSLQLIDNRQSYARNNNIADRMQQAVQQQRGKLTEISNIEESIYDKQVAADAAHLNNMALKDKIAYSTVSIELYQPKAVMQQVRLNEEHLGKYEPSISSKLIQALAFGWHIFEGILLFILKIWPLGLLAFVAYVLIKKYGRN